MKFLQIILAFALFALAVALSPDCPLSSQVTTCTPKCKEDSDCVSLGGKCCPNLCNNRSCVTKGNTNKSGDNKCGKLFLLQAIYRYSNLIYFPDASNSATGSYCGNVKCNAFEKCDLDKTSKRMKCVRS